ncbi:MAG: HlyD family efflux transporter periplasmic adaptor subunit, partial [Lautropia sp.]|nr:HlyD family efflux transporter periplasmic adaptor subunit [Lautropia sp.]
MKLPAPRTLFRLLIGIAVLGLLTWFALQEPAQLAHVEQVRHGPITRQFSEEGKTRLKARYVLTAPVSGTLLRIDLEPGDRVQAGQVLARIAPATSALLDASSRARAEADVQTGLAQQNAARERIRSARAAWKLALASRDRARALRPSNVISQEALEQAEARARSSLAELRGAQADEAAAAQRVSAARAVLAQEG